MRTAAESATAARKAATATSAATSVVAAILIAIFVISASVTIVLFDRGAYERMQAREGIAQSSGLTEQEVLENYNALLDYNSVFFAGPLVFPSLPMSESGRIHFEEVKAIFSAFQIALIVSAVLTALFCIIFFRKRQVRFLALGGMVTVLVPAIVVIAAAVAGWDRFFVLFHQLFFNNDFWVFDSRTDPVILILPDSWFLNCLVRIVAGVVISAIILMILPKTLEKIKIFRKI